MSPNNQSDGGCWSAPREAATSEAVTVTVAWIDAGVQDLVTIALPAGATIADAVAAARLTETYALDLGPLGYALRGRRAAPATILSPGDRVDVTRPLIVDPGDARRARAALSPVARSPRPPRS